MSLSEISAFGGSSGLTGSFLSDSGRASLTGEGQDALARLAASEINPVRQGEMLRTLDRMTGDRLSSDTLVAGAGVQLAQATTAAYPGGMSIPLDRLSPPDLGRIAIPLSRMGALGAVLSLSGDTPQPTQVRLADDLSLFVSANQQHAWFQKADGALLELGPVQFMPRSHRLDVPVDVRNGQISFDAGALQQAYGRPLPDNVLAMAGRPAGVPAALQTTSSGIERAMTGAPDPCKDLPGQRHHMIPAESMAANQRFLTRIGFQLDQPANMIRLPANQTQRTDMAQMCGETRPIHNGRHPGSYRQAVDDHLSRISGRLDSGQITTAEARAQVESLMSEIRQGLTSGRFQSVNDPAVVQFIRSIRP